MARYRIFKSVDLLVIIDTDDWLTEKFALDQSWYSYVSTEAPILYSVYQRSPERPLILDQPYTEFADEFGNVFDSDVLLQDYLDNILGKVELPSEIDTVIKKGKGVLKVTNSITDDKLDNLINQMKIMNFHLSIITENFITTDDV